VVRRIDRNLKGEVTRTLENQDLRQVDGGALWLPWRCVSKWHALYSKPDPPSPSPLFESELQVTALSHSPIGAEEFALKYNKPGTDVIDSTLPGSTTAKGGWVQYKVPADQKDLDAAIAHAVIEQQDRGRLTAPVWAGIAGVVVALALVFAGMKFRRRSAGRGGKP
jgi:hypothetical protein